jgi:hypothetical protein
MAPMRRGIALAKLSSLCHGAKLAEQRYG